MLLYNLHAIFKARQIDRPYSFLVKAGISPNTATRIINNDTKVIRLDHIEKICVLLCCEPKDLFVYKPNANQLLAENHPLNNLIKRDEDLAWLDNLKNIPLSDLKEMSKLIVKKKQDI
jgi:DNA-binding Xre family transcriptional regulator